MILAQNRYDRLPNFTFWNLLQRRLHTVHVITSIAGIAKQHLFVIAQFFANYTILALIIIEEKEKKELGGGEGGGDVLRSRIWI